MGIGERAMNTVTMTIYLQSEISQAGDHTSDPLFSSPVHSWELTSQTKEKPATMIYSLTTVKPVL